MGMLQINKQSCILLFSLLVASINFATFFELSTLYIHIELLVFSLILIYLALSGSDVRADAGFGIVSAVFLFVLVINMLRAGPEAVFSSANFILNLYAIPALAYLIGSSFRKAELGTVFRTAFSVLAPIALVIYYFFASDDYDFAGTLATGSVFGGVMSLYALIFASMLRGSKSKTDFFLFIISILLLILSEHRTGMLALAISLSVLFGYSPRRSRSGNGIVLVTLGLIYVFVFALAAYLFPPLLSKLFFYDEVALENLNTAGRANVWIMLYDEWTKDVLSFLFGGGLGHATKTIATHFPDALEAIAVPHNEWLRLGLDLGMLGIAIYVTFLKKIIGFSLLRIRNPIALAFAVHVFVEMMFSNAIFWAGSYLFILVIWCAAMAHPVQATGCTSKPALRLCGS